MVIIFDEIANMALLKLAGALAYRAPQT